MDQKMRNKISEIIEEIHYNRFNMEEIKEEVTKDVEDLNDKNNGIRRALDEISLHHGEQELSIDLDEYTEIIIKSFKGKITDYLESYLDE